MGVQYMWNEAATKLHICLWYGSRRLIINTVTRLLRTVYWLKTHAMRHENTFNTPTTIHLIHV